MTGQYKTLKKLAITEVRNVKLSYSLPQNTIRAA